MNCKICFYNILDIRHVPQQRNIGRDQDTHKSKTCTYSEAMFSANSTRKMEHLQWFPSNWLHSVNTCTWNRHLIQLSRVINEIQETRSRLQAWKGIQLEIANEDLINQIMFSFRGCKLEMAKHMGKQEPQLQEIFLQLYRALMALDYCSKCHQFWETGT